jgi:hypothetical protein
MPCLSFYFFSFFFYKIGEQEDFAGPAEGKELTPVRGEVTEKGMEG